LLSYHTHVPIFKWGKFRERSQFSVSEESTLRQNNTTNTQKRARMAIPNQHVYLIQEREFVRTGEPIYRLGGTVRIEQKYREFPTDSKIITILRVNDCVRAEKYLLTRFKERFVKRTDFGNKYFEGDEDQMTDEIRNVKDQGY